MFSRLKFLLWSLIVLTSSGYASDVDLISGIYKYANYSFSMPPDLAGGLNELGAKGAALEICGDGNIT